MKISLLPRPLVFVLAAISIVHAAAAQQTQIRLSTMTPGTEQVQIVTNGNFQQMGTPVGNSFPNPSGWNRFGAMYVGMGSNMVAADQGIVAQGVVSQANPVSGYFRSLTLQPATEYVVSAYLWNLGDLSNHVTTVVDLNDSSNEGQLTLYATDPGASQGYFVYVSFNTSNTGTNVTLRCFYDGLLGTGAAPQYYPAAAQWDNIAITRADLFRAPPSITTQPQSQTVVAGNNATFTVVAGGTLPLSYQWQFDGDPLSGASSSAYTVSNVQPANAGNYSVVVSNAANSIISAAASLTVRVPPSITQQPVSANGIIGGQVTLTVVATGPGLTYQWFKNAQPIQGAIDPQLTLRHLQPGDAGCYTVAVNNPDGRIVSDNSRLDVREANPFAEGLIAHFKFDSLGWPDGFTSLNSAPDGSNAVVKGTIPDWPQGQVGDALLLNGTNNHVVIPDYPKPSQAMTVAGWVLSSNGQWGPIINTYVSGGTPGSGGQFLVDVVLDDGVPTLRAQIEVGPTTVRASSPLNDTLNTWHHFAMSANGATLNIYWDGALIGATNYLGSINATPFRWLSLGANLTDTSGNKTNPPGLTGIPWSGAMDDIALWGRGLSAAEIQAIYQGGLSGSGVSEIRSGFTPKVTISASTAGGQVDFFWATAPGRIYQVEGRSDLGPQSQWVPVSGELPGTGERLDYTSTGIPGGGCRFFRVRSAGPRSLRVPEDFPSIQEAMERVADGGAIEIGPGTYPGPVVINNKKVTLRGSANSNAPTILIATNPAQAVISFVDGGHGALSSLTLEGGAAGIAAGSSNSCWRADVTADHLKISNATRGVYGSFGELRFTKVDISASQRHGFSIFDATLILLRELRLRDNGEIGMLLSNSKAKPNGDIALVIADCEVYGNSGGGIHIVGNTAPVFINKCNVHDNGLRGITFERASGTVLQSRINNNYSNLMSGQWGDGVVIFSGAAIVRDCNIEFNERAGVSIFGGCSGAFGSASLTFINNELLGHKFDVDYENFPSCTSSVTVIDGGGNTCNAGDCHAQTSGLAALPPLDLEP